MSASFNFSGLNPSSSVVAPARSLPSYPRKHRTFNIRGTSNQTYGQSGWRAAHRMRGDYQTASRAMETVCNLADEAEVKGWLKAQVAAYTNKINPISSQQILKAALEMNPRVTKPLEGIN